MCVHPPGGIQKVSKQLSNMLECNNWFDFGLFLSLYEIWAFDEVTVGFLEASLSCKDQTHYAYHSLIH